MAPSWARSRSVASLFRLSLFDRTGWSNLGCTNTSWTGRLDQTKISRFLSHPSVANRSADVTSPSGECAVQRRVGDVSAKEARESWKSHDPSECVSVGELRTGFSCGGWWINDSVRSSRRARLISGPRARERRKRLVGGGWDIRTSGIRNSGGNGFSGLIFYLFHIYIIYTVQKHTLYHSDIISASHL